jgi:hypothetical protein
MRWQRRVNLMRKIPAPRETWIDEVRRMGFNGKQFLFFVLT